MGEHFKEEEEKKHVGGPNTPPIVCPGHVRPLAELNFSEKTGDGIFMISACLDGLPMLRDGETGDWIGTFAGHKGAVWSAKLCKEARIAATGSGDFSAKIWDAINGSCLATLDHSHIVKTVDIAQDRQKLATAGHEGKVRIYDIETAEDNGSILTIDPPQQQNNKNKQINKIVWLPDQTNLIAAGGADGLIRIWDLRQNGSNLAILNKQFIQKDPGPIMDMEFKFIFGVGVLTVASGTSVKFFNTANWGSLARDEPLATPVHFKQEGGATLSPDGNIVMVGGGRHGGSFQGALGVEKNATRVGDVGSDLTVFAMDFHTGNIISERKGHCGPVRCLRYHPSGTSLATGSEDGTIRIWESTSSTTV
uniref:Serine-threonine kinase receptor-associated protein n=1 Tax=Aureoumbra lagunensis TaxID=44058 RepID=A0A7S3NI24_9STRA|mmetsp:Transcript_9509/g.13154  ORF Transcript_9509/g.13154 Transcript_9509/m.13154 type:complete len:364 (+) Transcript_9509:36-1127(+)